MSMSALLNHLGSIWYHSQPLEVFYSPNQFLGWDFFCRLLKQTGSSSFYETEIWVGLDKFGSSWISCTFLKLLFWVGFSHNLVFSIHPWSTSTLRVREGASQKNNLRRFQVHKMNQQGNPGVSKIGKMSRRQLKNDTKSHSLIFKVPRVTVP